MALNLEQIKALAPAVVAREVTIPEFNDSVWIGELTAWERESRVEQPFKARKEATGDETGLRAFLVAACLCKSAGREFLVVEREIPALAEALLMWPLPIFDRLFKACEDANGLGETAQQELEKN